MQWGTFHVKGLAMTSVLNCAIKINRVELKFQPAGDIYTATVGGGGFAP